MLARSGVKLTVCFPATYDLDEFYRDVCSKHVAIACEIGDRFWGTEISRSPIPMVTTWPSQRRFAARASAAQKYLCAVSNRAESCDTTRYQLVRRCEANAGAFTSFACFLFPVPRRRRGDQRGDELARGPGDLLHGAIEDDFIRPGRLVHAAQFPDKLHGRRTDFVVGRGRAEVRERLDVSTHGRIICGRAPAFWVQMSR